MLIKSLVKKAPKLAFTAIAVVMTVAMLITTVSVMGLTSFADGSNGKMFYIKQSSNEQPANVFIPLNLKSYFDSTDPQSFYAKLTFKAKMKSGNRPIVSVVRGNKSVSTLEYADSTFSEKGYVFNNMNDDKESDYTLLSSVYSKQTYEYTAIIRLRCNDAWMTFENGVSMGLLIGDFEHNGNWHDAYDYNTSFEFADPHLYILSKDSLDPQIDAQTGNPKEIILPEISESNFNTQVTYKHSDNPCKADNQLLNAPLNKWSIDGDASCIEIKNIPSADYFVSSHKLTRHAPVAATTRTTGMKEYWTCSECGSRMFDENHDKEYTKEELTIDKLPQKMIVVKQATENKESFNKDNVSGVAIPLNDFSDLFTGATGSKYYVKLTFKAKVFNGEKPIVGNVTFTKSGSMVTKSDAAAAKNVNNKLGGANDSGSTAEMNAVPCTYDSEKNTYTAYIKVTKPGVNNKLPNGAHQVITIGNTEHKNTTTSANADAYDSSLSFAFADPVAKLVNENGVEYSDKNLIEDIYESSLNFGKDSSFNDIVYQCLKSGDSANDSFTKLPYGKWSKDGNAENVYAVDIPDGFFENGHNYVKHNAKERTATEEGNIEYYTCDCKYCKGKYFKDKYGTIEATEDEVFLGFRMFRINSNGSDTANVFIPLNFTPYIAEGQPLNGVSNFYAKLKFKARMISGEKPIIGVVRGLSGDPDGSYSEQGYANNMVGDYVQDDTYSMGVEKEVLNAKDFLTSSYNPETYEYEAIILLRTPNVGSWITLKNGVTMGITIGNLEHNGNWHDAYNYDASFEFSDVHLYAMDNHLTTEMFEIPVPEVQKMNFNTEMTYKHSGNPCTAVNNLLAAPTDKWSVDGNADLISVQEMPLGYFEPGADYSSKLKITGGKNDEIISYSTDLKADTSYKIDIDYTENDAEFINDLTFFDMDGNEIELSKDDIQTPVDNVEGKHFSRIINTPADIVVGNNNNFKLSIGSKAKNDDGYIYVANIKVREIDTAGDYGTSLITNGNFSFALPGKVVPTKHLKFWTVASDDNYESLKTEKIAEGEFPDTIPAGVFVRDSVGNISTFTTIKSGKKYVLRFNSKYISDQKAKPFVEFTLADGSTTSNIGSYKVDQNSLYNTVYTFTAPSGLREEKNVRVGVDINDALIKGTYSGFELYELDSNGKETGDNLINDGNFIEAITQMTNKLKAYSKSKAEGVWMQQDIGNAYEVKRLNLTYFDKTTSKLLFIQGKNTNYKTDAPSLDGYLGDGEFAGSNLSRKLSLSAGKKYRLTANVKIVNNYDPQEYIDQGINSSKTEYLKNGILLRYSAGSSMKDVPVDITKSDTEYKETYTFTLPSDASAGTNNVTLYVNAMSGYFAAYVTDFSLVELNADNQPETYNLITNGNFATGDWKGWDKNGSFYNFSVLDIPENYFSKSNPNAKNMIVFRNPSDYSFFYQQLMLKNNTRYQLKVKGHFESTRGEDYLPFVTMYENHFNLKPSYGPGEDPFDRDADGVKKNGNFEVSAKTMSEYSKSEWVNNTQTITFRTSEHIKHMYDGNFDIRLEMRSASSGYWGNVELYEIDASGKRIGENLVANPDFTLGDDGLYAWTVNGSIEHRVAQQPSNFFEDASNFAEPSTMVYSDGSEASAAYSTTLKLDPKKKYYYTGYLVNMNSQGIKPVVEYRRKGASSGSYTTLDADYFYDPDRYFFEYEFEIPDDAYLDSNGKADVRISINNNNKGTGYFHSLMLTEEGRYVNLLGSFNSGSNYSTMPYNSDVFVFYYDDKKFNDGIWSGEYGISTGSVSGYVLGSDGLGIPNIKMMLGKYTVKTDKTGKYLFTDLQPGTYKLYLMGKKGEKLFCRDVVVEKGFILSLPKITYYENGEIDMDGGDTYQAYAMIKGTLLDADGNPIKGVPVYIRNNGYAITDKKGEFLFPTLTNFGEYDVYIILEDDSEYVFRKVELSEGRGSKITLIYDPDNGLSLFYIILFSAIGAVLIAGGVVLTIILVKKKKKKAAVAEGAEGETAEAAQPTETNE